MCDRRQVGLPSKDERNLPNDDLNSAFCLQESFDLSSISFHSAANFSPQSMGPPLQQREEAKSISQRLFYQIKHKARPTKEEEQQALKISQKPSTQTSFGQIKMVHSEHRHSRSIQSLERTLTKIKIGNNQLSMSTLSNNENEVMFEMIARDYSGKYEDSKIMSALNLFINKEEDEEGSQDEENTRKRRRER